MNAVATAEAAITTDLAALAAEINIEHAAALDHARSAVQRARHAGELLLQAKRQLVHGKWLPWLKANCPGISQRSVQGYMRLARHCMEAPQDADGLEDLTLRDALAQLSAPQIRNGCVSDGETEYSQCSWFAMAMMHLDEDAALQRRVANLRSELDAICVETYADCADERMSAHMWRLGEICKDVSLGADIATLRARIICHLGRAFNDKLTLADICEATPEAINAVLGVNGDTTLKDWMTSGCFVSGAT